MSDRIALMSNGHILQYASPTEIFQHPENRQVAAYFGKANYIEGIVQKEQFDSDYISCEAKGYADGKYELLVRPFDVKVIAGGSAVEIREMTYLGETVDLYLRDEKRTYGRGKSRNRICTGEHLPVSGRKGVSENETCNI